MKLNIFECHLPVSVLIKSLNNIFSDIDNKITIFPFGLNLVSDVHNPQTLDIVWDSERYIRVMYNLKNFYKLQFVQPP